jgi:hypothetical protein
MGLDGPNRHAAPGGAVAKISDIWGASGWQGLPTW